MRVTGIRTLTWPFNEAIKLWKEGNFDMYSVKLQ